MLSVRFTLNICNFTQYCSMKIIMSVCNLSHITNLDCKFPAHNKMYIINEKLKIWSQSKRNIYAYYPCVFEQTCVLEIEFLNVACEVVFHCTILHTQNQIEFIDFSYYISRFNSCKYSLTHIQTIKSLNKKYTKHQKYSSQ